MHNWQKRSSYLFLAGTLLISLLSSCIGLNQSNQTSSRAKTQIAPTLFHCPNDALAQTKMIQVVVDTACPIGPSQFSLGLTHTDNSLIYSPGTNDLAAVNAVKTLIKDALPYQNTHIMGWGLPDPWPDPTSPEPNDWSLLDQRLQMAVDTGSTPVISLDEAPWWMKGTIGDGGRTRALTAVDEWTVAAYESRILDNKMSAWLHLVQRVAERYMVAPYNVRYFQVWNELKGYYDPKINNYDFTTSAGDPSGPNTEHGYTYMYNQVYTTLLNVAKAHRIPTDSIKVGGPYVFMDTWSSRGQSDPSNVVKPYGVFDQRPLDVLQYWLQHKAGAGFITVDGSLENRDTNKLLTDPFTAAEVFGDVVQWIRSLDPTLYPGSTTLPVWLAEWFASPHAPALDENFDNAVKSYAMIKFLKAGGATALEWGGSGDGTSDQGLWSPTDPGGGQPYAWYFTAKALKDYFSAGTQIYRTTISDPTSVEALASLKKILLVNKTAKTITVSVDKETVQLAPYEVKILDRK